MSVAVRRLLRATALTLGLLAVLGTCALAQPETKFGLKRTKKETIPMNFVLLGGYNGMTKPSDNLQDMFDHTNESSWSGYMLGFQALLRIDTLGVIPFWGGLEFSAARKGKRWLADKSSVSYPGETVPVQYTETLGYLGVDMLFVFGPWNKISIVLGGGSQFLNSKVDTDTQINGLVPEQWIPAAIAGMVYHFFTYEHGSIDANFRFSKTFGNYGSLEFQTLLGFSFNF
jgi:hypothetical protein